MNECGSLGGLVLLLFVGGIVYLIVHNIEKPNNKQPEPENKTCDADVHIGSKVCVERKIEEPGKCDFRKTRERWKMKKIIGYLLVPIAFIVLFILYMLPNKDDERIREQYGRNKRRC